MSAEEMEALGKEALRYGKIYLEILEDLVAEGWSRTNAKEEARKRAFARAVMGPDGTSSTRGKG